jgi:hypothetical protein
MVDKFIAHLNIAHFRDQLATEHDEAKRQSLLRLLAEEEAKLATALGDPPEQKRR